MMNRWRFILRSLRHYWRNNLAIALGVAITTAVITGALLVGDSITHSLEKAVEYRLGNISHTLNGGDRFFTTGLATRIAEESETQNAPVMQLSASAQTKGGKLTIPQVDFYGIEKNFALLNNTDSAFLNLSDNDVIISENLAKRLDAKTGDFVLFHITKAGVIPSNTPFVSEEGQVISRRFKVKFIARGNFPGRFHLQNSQTAPFNAFVSLDRLNELMELENKANLILFSLNDNEEETVIKAIQKSWTEEDLNLKISAFDSDSWQVTSERVFIDPANAKLITENFPKANPVITYFVNYFAFDEKRTPYSFVSTTSGLEENETYINSWLADDLNAQTGDTIKFIYFTVGPLRELITDSTELVVKGILPMNNPLCTPKLMPDIPGLSDAGSCKEWETGVPVNLEAIRDKDEEYWNEFTGTPKAFINTATAEKLWTNRFGTYTSFITKEKPEINGRKIPGDALSAIGVTFINVKSQGLFAAANGTDFGGLFLGLSFFIIAGGLLLTVLMFSFHIEQRKRETATLKALGFTTQRISRLIMPEMIPVTVAGIVIGIALGIGYNNLVFYALNSLWSDIVRTEVLVPTITVKSLIIGALTSGVISVFTMFMHLRITGRRRNKQSVGKRTTLWHRFELILSIAIILAVPVVIIVQFIAESRINSALFFPAGGMLIIAFMGLSDIVLRRISRKENTTLRTGKLLLANLSRNKNRSLMVIFLLLTGTFLVISTGANKKDMFSNAMVKSSGTGGFLYYGETSRPILKTINGNADFNLPEGLSFMQMRVRQGDDASCLNLNKIRNPRLMTVNPDELYGRFSFSAFADGVDTESPWEILNTPQEDVIPAIADQTVIQWGLEKKVGDTLQYIDAYGDTVNVRLMAGLAASIFQGNILLGESDFMRMYPYSSGTSSFLIAGEEGIMPNDTLRQDIERAFRDYGLALDGTGERLARFKSVENTYLSIFLALGALGLLLGTIGLAIILGKTILERKEETDTLKALGFTKRKIVRLLTAEYIILMISGVFMGSVAAVIAVLPAFLSANTDNSPGFIAIILLVIILNGFIWMYVVARGLIRK